jgi:2-amino-4-hydroxy-6-hydroxymethyldihydropteridine diphosphokinase
MKNSRVFLSLGSNTGDRQQFLRKAREAIAEQAGTILQESAVYETEPWGNTHQPLFLNQVLEISTSFEPDGLLHILLHIEKELGRVRGEVRWMERTIDLDILYYGSRVLKSDSLILPHQELFKRRFILLPLAEIAGDFSDPATGLTVAEMLEACKDELKVIRVQ